MVKKKDKYVATENTITNNLIRKNELQDMLDIEPPPFKRGFCVAKWNKRWRHPQTKLNQCNHLIHVMAKGGHVARVCVDLGITEKTFFDWRKRYPEWEEAYQIAKLYSKAFYEEFMLRGVAGQIPGFNANGAKYIMAAKMGWRGEKEGAGVNIENMNVLDTGRMSEEELQNKITMMAKKIQKLDLESNGDK